jgi:hypothetical protein
VRTKQEVENSRGSNGTESLLPGRVPDLELDLLPVDFDGTDLEIDTDGGYVVSVERVVREPEQQRALPNTWKSPNMNMRMI